MDIVSGAILHCTFVLKEEENIMCQEHVDKITKINHTFEGFGKAVGRNIS